MGEKGFNEYVLFFFLRLDIDECKDTDVCPENSYCVNSEGTFNCSCNVGYSGTTNCASMLRSNAQLIQIPAKFSFNKSYILSALLPL